MFKCKFCAPRRLRENSHKKLNNPIIREMFNNTNIFYLSNPKKPMRRSMTAAAGCTLVVEEKQNSEKSGNIDDICRK